MERRTKVSRPPVSVWAWAEKNPRWECRKECIMSARASGEPWASWRRRISYFLTSLFKNLSLMSALRGLVCIRVWEFHERLETRWVQKMRGGGSSNTRRDTPEGVGGSGDGVGVELWVQASGNFEIEGSFWLASLVVVFDREDGFPRLEADDLLLIFNSTNL